jgi:hypothetical protein
MAIRLSGLYETVEEHALRTGLSAATVKRQCKNWAISANPSIPSVKVGKIWLIRKGN